MSDAALHVQSRLAESNVTPVGKKSKTFTVEVVSELPRLLIVK